jgi:hypothetical protein
MCCQNEIHGELRIASEEPNTTFISREQSDSFRGDRDTCGRAWHATAAHCVLDIGSAGDRGEEREIHSVMGNSTVPDRLLPKPIFEIT